MSYCKLTLQVWITLVFMGNCLCQQPENIETDYIPIEINQNIMFQEIEDYIARIKSDSVSISDARREKLGELAAYIQLKLNAREKASLTFICTHNSRRSHLSQVWSAIAAAHYGLNEKIDTYSGGTEATAFNPRAVSALERAGFEIENPGGQNPHYALFYSENEPKIECWSKVYDDPSNPSNSFAAVMTCSAADEGCPLVHGSDGRISLPYEDPKIADNTPKEQEIYDERCEQIATEIFYAFSLLELK